MPLALQNRYSISVEKQGPSKISKQAFPLRYGKYSEIRASDYEFIYNLNGEIKFIRGLNPDWPHPAEQLKRTDGHDWIYYTGLISWRGEYYMPCLPCPSNPVTIDHWVNCWPTRRPPVPNKGAIYVSPLKDSPKNASCCPGFSTSNNGADGRYIFI